MILFQFLIICIAQFFVFLCYFYLSVLFFNVIFFTCISITLINCVMSSFSEMFSLESSAFKLSVPENANCLNHELSKQLER